jgi:hypothetical protein
MGLSLAFPLGVQCRPLRPPDTLWSSVAMLRPSRCVNSTLNFFMAGFARLIVLKVDVCPGRIGSRSACPARPARTAIPLKLADSAGYAPSGAYPNTAGNSSRQPATSLAGQHRSSTRSTRHIDADRKRPRRRSSGLSGR